MSWGPYSHFFAPDQPVVFVDLETTGLSPTVDEIIEVGAIRIEPGKPRHKAVNALIRPERPIPRHITAITGISQEMVDNSGITLTEAMDQFCDLAAGHPIVAYNASFDAAFLKTACVGRSALTEAAGHACALKLARFKWPGLVNYKLATVAAHLGIGATASHRALADAMVCVQVYYRALGVTATPTD